MRIKKVFSSNDYQIIRAELQGGDSISEGYVTSFAFVSIIKGRAKVSLKEMEFGISEGGSFLMQEKKSFNLEVVEDLIAYIFCTPEATFKGID